MDIGEQIHNHKKKSDYRKKNWKKLGVSQQHIAQYENGKRIPKLETLIKISEALDCEVSDIDENIIVHYQTFRLEPTPENIERYKTNAEVEKQTGTVSSEQS